MKNIDVISASSASNPSNPEVEGSTSSTMKNVNFIFSAFNLNKGDSKMKSLMNILLVVGALLIAMLFMPANVQPVAAEGPEFEETQSIPTNGAHDGEYFTIDGETYIIQTTCGNGAKISVANIV